MALIYDSNNVGKVKLKLCYLGMDHWAYHINYGKLEIYGKENYDLQSQCNIYGKSMRNHGSIVYGHILMGNIKVSKGLSPQYMDGIDHQNSDVLLLLD